MYHQDSFLRNWVYCCIHQLYPDDDKISNLWQIDMTQLSWILGFGHLMAPQVLHCFKAASPNTLLRSNSFISIGLWLFCILSFTAESWKVTKKKKKNWTGKRTENNQIPMNRPLDIDVKCLGKTIDSYSTCCSSQHLLWNLPWGTLTALSRRMKKASKPWKSGSRQVFLLKKSNNNIVVNITCKFALPSTAPQMFPAYLELFEIDSLFISA